MKKLSLFFIIFTALFSTNIQAKSKKTTNTVQKSIKDQTCQKIRDIFDELHNLLKEAHSKDIEMFLEKNKDFFEAHNQKIKRFSQTMDTFFLSREKKQAQKELCFIQAFYICNSITNVDDEDQIAEFVKANYDKSTWYINSIAHVQRLHFNFTGFADQIKAIVKLIKKNSFIKSININSELKYSLINKLESILYTVTQQGEHKIEKRKQRLHLAAECAKGFFRGLARRY